MTNKNINHISNTHLNINLQDFIEKHKYLFRDIKTSHLSLASIIARVIDYGDLNQLQEIYNIVGEEQFKKAFLENLIDKNGKIKNRININDYKMIYLLAYRLKLHDKIPLGDIIRKAKTTSSFNLKSKK